jgi:GDPmannose 4,6-dehydratase
VSILKILIFGISGQDGYYLSRFLKGRNIKVIGVSRSQGDWFVGDVSEKQCVDYLIKKHKPDFIFHFAANSTTHHSAVFDNHNAISTGSINILESVKEFCPKCKVFLSGSAVQFRNDGNPINENTPFAPSSPYAVSRIHSVYAARYYRDAFGLKVYVGYFFNHDSPRRTDRHVNQKIVLAVKKIAAGSNERLVLGNIDVQKEFNFAGDIINAAWTLVNQEEYFEAVLGSGESYTIREWVEYCFKKEDLDWKGFVTIQEKFIPEYNRLVSDPKIIKSLDWSPEVDFYKLADLMME